MGRPRIDQLTPPDLDALAFILDHHRETGREPTYAQVGRHLGLSTPHNASANVRRLVEHGRLEKGPGKAQPYKVPRAGAGLVLPLVGITAAGPPLEGEPWDESFSFSAHFGKPGLFMVQVRGTSMLGAQIRDRDLVVLKPAADVKGGEIGLFRVRGGHTLKKMRRGEWVWWGQLESVLESANPDVPPIDPDVGDEPIGVLVGVVRVGVR